jgi:hypothetical protein
MEFLIQVKSGTKVWLPYWENINQTVQFERFCEARPYLVPLLHPLKVWKEIQAVLKIDG